MDQIRREGEGKNAGLTARLIFRTIRAMNPRAFSPLVLVAIIIASTNARAGTPEIAKLLFGPAMETGEAEVGAEGERPAWILDVAQKGGQFLETPPAWQVGNEAPEGAGQIEIRIDRSKMNEDLVATILFEAAVGADFAVQLFDAQDRVVVVDLFGNLVDVGAEATTDTFVVGLRKYPSAEKIVLRRIKGEVKVYGVVLYPVVTEGEPVNDALARLAKRLGDPLSPDNPLHEGLREVAAHGKVAIAPQGNASPKQTKPGQLKRPVYPAATLPTRDGVVFPSHAEGLVAHWSFDPLAPGQDQAAGRHPLTTGGTVTLEESFDAGAMRLYGDKNSCLYTRPSTAFASPDAITVSAWVKPASRKGGQIVWFGDRRGGRDPWSLYLHGDGRVRFRSDRSVTSKPVFEVRQEEIVLKPGGGLDLNQHVATDSPGVLPLNQWSFVTGRIEKQGPRQRILTLFVNGEPVSEVRTTESVDYTTDRMWVALGSVHQGEGQNVDASLDEVRIYDRALSNEEVRGLYRLPLNASATPVAQTTVGK